jgi:hypothetical protein
MSFSFFLKINLGELPNGFCYLRVAGVDSAWEQEKLEARKMLVEAAESHPSSTPFVGHKFWGQHYFCWIIKSDI